MKISQYTDNELKCAYTFYQSAIQRLCNDTILVLDKIKAEQEKRRYGKECVK